MDRRSEQRQAIQRALGARAQSPAPGAQSNWRFALENGAEIDVRARLVSQWFELTASTTTTRLPLSRVWSMLRHNANLNGAVRMALMPNAGEAHLRGEIFVDADGDLDIRIRDLCERARAAFPVLHDRALIDRSGPDTKPTAVADTLRDGHRLVQLFTESGWPYAERASGRIEVPIECGPAVFQAQLELAEDGALCAVTHLVDASGLTSAARSATALLLLNTSAIVRSVKGVVIRRDGVEWAGLAAACEPPRSGADLDRALTALAVACGVAGREAQALRHEALACEYLVWRAPEFLDDSRDIFNNHQSDHNNQYSVEERPCLQQL